MSFMRDLDEFTERELFNEQRRRHAARISNKCDYCARPVGSKPPCKFPERHKGETGEPKQ